MPDDYFSDIIVDNFQGPVPERGLHPVLGQPRKYDQGASQVLVVDAHKRTSPTGPCASHQGTINVY